MRLHATRSRAHEASDRSAVQHQTTAASQQRACIADTTHFKLVNDPIDCGIVPPDRVRQRLGTSSLIAHGKRRRNSLQAGEALKAVGDRAFKFQVVVKPDLHAAGTCSDGPSTRLPGNTRPLRCRNLRA
jgi:hypothetical protein